MPYITQVGRRGLDPHINQLVLHSHAPGDLAYAITRLIDPGTGSRFHDYAQAIGVLECVKLELYRRAIGPYEDQKKEENGDIF